MNEVHERIIGHTFFSKLLQYKIFHYLPIQANRDIDAFSKDWSALLVRKSLECEKVCLFSILRSSRLNVTF